MAKKKAAKPKMARVVLVRPPEEGTIPLKNILAAVRQVRKAERERLKRQQAGAAS
ncbi:MAG: hypothetical protein K2X87_18880 [Gemmataceae bacterium]|nr:hypothetical protein [Gemmataceae bacterium]